MRYVAIFLLLWGCAEEEHKPGKDVLQFTLKSLKAEKDSLKKVMSDEMGRSFEYEAVQDAASLTKDTAYLSLQRRLNQLDAELKSIDRRIEDTEEELYKPD